jgi:signal transduction histidine kinase
MLLTSRELVQNLEEDRQPGCEIAEIIEEQLKLCMQQLVELQDHLPQSTQQAAPERNSIDQLSRRLESITGGNTELIISGNWNQLDPALNQDIYSIIHEAATNAIRHANPTLIIIGLQINPRATVVSIENNGLPMPKNLNEGMGIPLMRYRALRIDAALSITESPQQRTLIQCVIPRNHKNMNSQISAR